MSLKGLAWSLAGPFILFGLAMAAADGTAWHPVWGGLSVLSLGGFALAMAAGALATGEVRVQYSTIRHADRPWLFRTTVAVVGAAGAIVTVGGAWLLIAGAGS